MSYCLLCGWLRPLKAFSLLAISWIKKHGRDALVSASLRGKSIVLWRESTLHPVSSKIHSITFSIFTQRLGQLYLTANSTYILQNEISSRIIFLAHYFMFYRFINILWVQGSNRMNDIMSCQENLLNRQGDSEIGVSILGICSTNKNKAKTSYKHGY
jgi:hypothetical protein